jgi:hypothetical protein
MDWIIDIPTQQAALAVPLQLPAGHAQQFIGRNFNAENWTHRIHGQAHWPPAPIISSPETIIATFQAGEYLEALALVVSWGRMWRTANAIYGERDLHQIETTLRQCAQSIHNTNSIEASWELLTGRLHWTQVIASKTLHFLSRANGHENDAAVPIDNKVILKTVWPHWKNLLAQNQVLVPSDWKGEGFAAYIRYMTVILTWAEQRHWSTTQMENTIYGEYKINN